MSITLIIIINKKGKKTMDCVKCDYEWMSRIEQPKSCPRCKTRLDFGKANITLINTENMELDNGLHTE